MWSANLLSANLEGANLEGVNLEGANLERANLERANLEGANLQEADLEGANLKGATLTGATIDRKWVKQLGLDAKKLNLQLVDGPRTRWLSGDRTLVRRLSDPAALAITPRLH